jgi:Niemann-Pick C1 protein
VFIPFYEQYVVIAALTGQLFALAFGVLVALHLLFELSWRSSLVLVVIVASTMTLAGGALTWTGAGLNSTTAINLVAGTGIAIELSIHLLRFIQSRRAALAIDEACASSGDSRAAQTPYGRLAARVVAGAVDSGVTTLTGITLTKLLGLAVLTAAQSRLTRVDFVGVLVPVVAFGGLFTLLVLPALLLALPWLIEPHADIADPAAAKETELFDEYNDE